MPSLKVRPVLPGHRRAIRSFYELEMQLYSDCPHWVQPLWADRRALFDTRGNAYYEHSEAAFFVVHRGPKVVGRICVMEPHRFNLHRNTRQAHFGYMEMVDDSEVAAALIDAASKWARERGLVELVGPTGLGAMEGRGLLVEGFDEPQMMTMSPYNPPYYAHHLESQGFGKAVDYASYTMEPSELQARIQSLAAAERIRRTSVLRLVRPRSRAELRVLAPAIGAAYNEAFRDNWEFYPLTDLELRQLAKAMTLVADPSLMQVLMHGDEVAGFLLVFPDISMGLRRAGGRLWPTGLFHILRAVGQARVIALNGVGLLPKWRNRGAHVLLYMGLLESLQSTRYQKLEVIQVAETASRMRGDMRDLGTRAHKLHRVYRKSLQPIGGQQCVS